MNFAEPTSALLVFILPQFSKNDNLRLPFFTLFAKKPILLRARRNSTVARITTLLSVEFFILKGLSGIFLLTFQQNRNGAVVHLFDFHIRPKDAFFNRNVIIRQLLYRVFIQRLRLFGARGKRKTGTVAV